MVIKCTIGKDKKKYYFRDGMKISVKDLTPKEILSTKCVAKKVAKKKTKFKPQKKISPKKMKKKEILPLDKLPTECLANVFSKLDLKTISNLRKTCKKFNLKEFKNISVMLDGVLFDKDTYDAEIERLFYSGNQSQKIDELQRALQTGTVHLILPPPKSMDIPLFYFILLDDVRRIVLSHIPKDYKDEYIKVMEEATIGILDDKYRFLWFTDKGIKQSYEEVEIGTKKERIDIIWMYGFDGRTFLAGKEIASFSEWNTPYSNEDAEKFMEKVVKDVKKLYGRMYKHISYIIEPERRYTIMTVRLTNEKES
jgi:hypothetical protein